MKRPTLYLAIGCGIILVLYLTLLLAFRSESHPRAFTFGTPPPPGQSYLELFLLPTTLDVHGATLDLNLRAVLHGPIAQDRGSAPTRDLIVTTDAHAGPQHDAWGAGQLFPLDLTTLSVTGGSLNDYPQDTYSAEVGVAVNFADAPKSAPLPLVLHYQRNLPDMTVTPTLATGQTDTTTLRLHIERSQVVIIIAWYLNVMMLLLALGLVAMTVMVGLRLRTMSIHQIIWGATLLFAFPAIRDALPGAPPLGVLSDVAMFFWAESLVTVASLALVVIWLRGGDAPKGTVSVTNGQVAAAQSPPSFIGR